VGGAGRQHAGDRLRRYGRVVTATATITVRRRPLVLITLRGKPSAADSANMMLEGDDIGLLSPRVDPPSGSARHLDFFVAIAEEETSGG